MVEEFRNLQDSYLDAARERLTNWRAGGDIELRELPHPALSFHAGFYAPTLRAKGERVELSAGPSLSLDEFRHIWQSATKCRTLNAGSRESFKLDDGLFCVSAINSDGDAWAYHGVVDLCIRYPEMQSVARVLQLSD